MKKVIVQNILIIGIMSMFTGCGIYTYTESAGVMTMQREFSAIDASSNNRILVSKECAVSVDNILINEDTQMGKNYSIFFDNRKGKFSNFTKVTVINSSTIYSNKTITDSFLKHLSQGLILESKLENDDSSLIYQSIPDAEFERAIKSLPSESQQQELRSRGQKLYALFTTRDGRMSNVNFTSTALYNKLKKCF